MKIPQKIYQKFPRIGICLTVVLFFVISTFSYAQKTPPAEQYFVALYTVGENWDADKSPADQPYFKEHSEHLSNLRKDSTIVIGARYNDTGMIIIKAIDQTKAENLLLEDIAVRNELFNVEIHLLQPFYKGRLD